MEVAFEQWNEREHILSSIQRIPTVTGERYIRYIIYLRAGRVRETYRGGFSAVLTNFPKLGGNTEHIRPKS